MASFFSKMKSGAVHLPRGTAGQRGVKGFVVDKGERYGSALAFGYLKGYYRERFTYKDYGGDLLAGVLLTGASAVLQIMSGGRSGLAPHLERVGDAGVSSYLNSIGTSMGAQKAGRSVVVLEKGKQLPSPARSTGIFGDVLGMVPQAMGGTYLTADEIAKYASKR